MAASARGWKAWSRSIRPRILPIVHVLALKLLGTVVAILAVIAAIDYFFQYRQWFERQKMSVRELKEEFKQTDGDPAVKGKIKQIRQNRMRKRMMAAVPKASVVITNPTHYAVALHYERGMNAPVCVAKGVDLIARKIREVASEHGIPVVENPPLARAVHATVEIDQEIKPEHYKAVAEVIGYVMRLNRSFAGGGRRAHRFSAGSPPNGAIKRLRPTGPAISEGGLAWKMLVWAASLILRHRLGETTQA